MGAVSKRGEWASGVPMNSAEVSATLRGWGGYALDLCRPGRFAQAQHQRLTGTKEAK
jgi:hypothetical protein